MDDVKNLKFQCADDSCDSTQLECIEERAEVTSEITTIRSDGDFDFGAPIINDSVVDRFQCKACGRVIKDKAFNEAITDQQELAEWLEENCDQS